MIEDILQKNRKYVEYLIPYADGKMLDKLHRYGRVLEEEYLEEGISVKAYVPVATGGTVL